MRGLSYSQIVQTFSRISSDGISDNDNKNFNPSRIEFLNVIVVKVTRKKSAQSNTLSCVEELFLARGPSSSAEVRGLVIHDIKEIGVRQQGEQEDKRDEEIGDEVTGEVEEVMTMTME